MFSLCFASATTFSTHPAIIRRYRTPKRAGFCACGAHHLLIQLVWQFATLGMDNQSLRSNWNLLTLVLANRARELGLRRGGQRDGVKFRGGLAARHLRRCSHPSSKAEVS